MNSNALPRTNRNVVRTTLSVLVLFLLVVFMLRRRNS